MWKIPIQEMEQTDGKPVWIVTSPKFSILKQFWVSQVWQKFLPYLYRSLLSTLYVHGLGPVLPNHFGRISHFQLPKIPPILGKKSSKIWPSDGFFIAFLLINTAENVNFCFVKFFLWNYFFFLRYVFLSIKNFTS